MMRANIISYGYTQQKSLKALQNPNSNEEKVGAYSLNKNQLFHISRLSLYLFTIQTKYSQRNIYEGQRSALLD